VECVFGIVCNKWTVFHRAIDVCQDFCEVIVKTCCIQQNFVRETAFSARICYTNVRLDSIKAVGSRGNVTGTDMGSRVQKNGNVFPWGPRWGDWQGSSLPGIYV